MCIIKVTATILYKHCNTFVKKNKSFFWTRSRQAHELEYAGQTLYAEKNAYEIYVDNLRYK